MADENSGEGRSGAELQGSQSGGGSGQFGGNRNQEGQASGQQGGGPSDADLSHAGGSSGSGGYGSSQNVANHQGQGEVQPGLAGSALAQGGGHAHGQSRGERWDEEQGGGRAAADLDQEETGQGPSELAVDQAAHQDRGQTGDEFDREIG
jgi:hypothetical protein